MEKTDYLERMKTELADLSIKTESLNDFIRKENDLSDYELALLDKQLNIMLEYELILKIRIKLATAKLLTKEK